MRVWVEGKRATVGVRDTREAAESLADHVAEDLERGHTLEATLNAAEPNFIYFVQEGDERGPIKIGRARNPMRRLLALQTSTARPLRLLCTFPGGAKLEATLHAAFSGARMKGEWFDPTPLMLGLVDELLGQFTSAARRRP